MNKRLLKGMIPCRVECLSYGPWFVTFGNRKSLFLQWDFDQAAFAVNCGAIKATKDWNGVVESLGSDWNQFDPESIHHCPEEYLGVARNRQT